MHVDVDRSFEKSRIATVVVLDRRVTRIIVDHVRELRVARQIDIEFDRIGGWRTNVIEVHFVRLQIVL